MDLGKGGRLSAQAANGIMRVAAKYETKLLLKIGSKTVNAKSMMGMVSLGEVYGILRLTADGKGEVEALDAVTAAIRAALGI